MPELPEVETLRRALAPLAEGRVLAAIHFFRSDIRYPIPRRDLREHAVGRRVSSIVRRGKYLLLETDEGSILLHLGMSGRVIQRAECRPEEKHTHVVFHFAPDIFLHFIDPRRFGCVLWIPRGSGHPLLDHLGLEPFARETTAEALFALSRGRRAPIKSFLMDSRNLVGVGNIYACEAMFSAGISPRRPAGKISVMQWDRLLDAVRSIMNKSIAGGGTTLRDFYSADGSAGYFSVDLKVYGREGERCPRCHAFISRMVQSGRSTFFCRNCQKG